MFKVNSKDTSSFGVFIIVYKHVLLNNLALLLLTLSMFLSLPRFKILN